MSWNGFIIKVSIEESQELCVNNRHFLTKKLEKNGDFFFLSANLTNFSNFLLIFFKILIKKYGGEGGEKKKQHHLALARRRVFLFPFFVVPWSWLTT